MKPYQHHDTELDKGKATPHPKQPTRYTYRGRGSSMSFNRADFLRERHKKPKKKALSKAPRTILATILALIPRRKAARSR